MTVYLPEEFSESERAVLSRHFTNLDGPVFALVDLPEVAKGALFARYSRSPKSLRRLFLDEFAGDFADSGTSGVVSEGVADRLYEKVFVEYGDDSVAQLGGVHLACEQASNVLTKVLEWGRLMSYLEQSTRYISYDARIGGRYRFHRDPEVVGGPLGVRFVGDMDRMFDSYKAMATAVTDHVRTTVPKSIRDSDFVYRQATKAKALDAVRGSLPAAALSNVGIYGSGQGYESLLLRMRAHPLPEARHYASLMLEELRKVIPAFMRRVDQPDRGVAWSAYLSDVRERTDHVVGNLLGGVEVEPCEEVVLTDFDPEGEDKVIAAICYSSSSLREAQIRSRVASMSTDERTSLIRAYVGDRQNRRHRPGRAFEATSYRFDVLGDYGAFRDLQRHRLMTIEWQRLSTSHGWVLPDLVEQSGVRDLFEESMERSAALHDDLIDRHPIQAQYAVAMAYRIRYLMHFNARQAIHLLELRSAPQGHPSYRRVAKEMHRQIGEVAGHRAIAAAMVHMGTEAPALERLESERRAEQRRDGGASLR